MPTGIARGLPNRKRTRACRPVLSGTDLHRATGWPAAKHRTKRNAIRAAAAFDLTGTAITCPRGDANSGPRAPIVSPGSAVSVPTETGMIFDPAEAQFAVPPILDIL